MNVLAASFTVSGAHGWLIFIALIVFAVAAIIAYVAPAHRLVHVLIAAGLAVFMLSQLWS